MSTPERLAYWYFRLNGFLTIENFVLHPDQGTNQRTDADLLAVRFCHRAENLIAPMEDDDKVCRGGAYANVMIAEVKRGACALNGPWTRQGDRNVDRVLSAIGCVPEALVAVAAEALYSQAFYETADAEIRLVAIGDWKSELAIPALQLQFDEMISFIWRRFRDYDRQKMSVGNWAPDGIQLRRAFDRSRHKPDIFRADVRRIFGLSAGAAA